MDSGRQWSFVTDYVQLLGASDRTAFATGLGQSEQPGTKWTYNNAAVQTLEQVLQQATGEDVATFAEQRLFEPLGMTHTKMSRDRAGNPQLFEGIQSTCLDLARFGELILDGGTWHGKQIVSSSWIRQATGRSSSKLNAGYGYLWWLNRKGTLASPIAATSVGGAKSQTTKPKAQIVPGAPADMFWALGLGNQLIQIDPGTKTVVVRLGPPEPNPQPPTFGPAEASKVVTEAVEASRVIEGRSVVTTASDHPVFRNGGVSYLHIPARDPSASALFYRAVFGWRLSGSEDRPGFEDGSGHVIGKFVTGQAPVGTDGVRPYVYVDDLDPVLARVTANGGAIVTPPFEEGDLTVATFRDVAGNVVGVWT